MTLLMQLTDHCYRTQSGLIMLDACISCISLCNSCYDHNDDDNNMMLKK